MADKNDIKKGSTEKKRYWKNPKWFLPFIIPIAAAIVIAVIYNDAGISQQINGDNNVQIVDGENITINSYTEKELYLSPSEKLIKPDMAIYEFPLKIVNELPRDFNDVGLVIIFPEKFGMHRIMVEPVDKSEKIVKYNGSLEIMMPGYGFSSDGYNYYIYDIESIYKRETKNYIVKVDTRDYDEEFYMYFKWTDLNETPELKEVFKGVGVE
jgi:hypothetical protein